ncbi:drebrin [Geospiza fortis]|uniref:Drebrin n=1 Tax=Geospiza fortis TaxID=48883 RepID=A0A8N5ELV2_GEOFO|nr:drebrin [Geospiza fortis]
MGRVHQLWAFSSVEQPNVRSCDAAAVPKDGGPQCKQDGEVGGCPTLLLALAHPWCLPRALYTYEDGSDDLKLAASGGGGLLELSGHFEIQKVMYGFCSVKDPQAVLPKYVLVNWVGEDVPDARKCACASHVAKIAEFFQGVDVIVNASSVEDIDPGAIGQRLSNGLARVSSPVLHRLRLREDENAEPVGTTYQKTDATVEMKRLNREQFWEQAKKEEELGAEEARQRLKEQSIFGDQQDEDDRQQFRKSESEVEEAAAIIAQRPDNPRDFFKQQERVASGSSDAVSPGSHRTGSQSDAFRKSPSPSAQEPGPATPEQHWPFPGPEDKAIEPPGDEPSPRPVWTEGGDALGDLVTLEPTEPSLPPVADEPQTETPPIANGEMAPKDGTPGRGEQASEGYFSQSQEEEVPPTEELSAKAPQPVFYNKPPEIDITCWDADPLPEEEESFGGAL